MTMHGPHGSIVGSGLADDCPRCQQHANHPLDSLDDDNLDDLVYRIQANQDPRSTNEAVAMGHVRTAINVSRRLAGLGTQT